MKKILNFFVFMFLVHTMGLGRLLPIVLIEFVSIAIIFFMLGRYL